MRDGDINYDKNFKERILFALDQNMSPTEISNKFGVSRSSIYRWMNRTGDSLERRSVAGRPTSLNLNEVNKVLAYMQNPATNYGFESPLWTGPRIKALVKKKFRKNLHRSTVHRMLTEKKQSYKKVESRWSEADKARQSEWIKKTIPAIKRWAKKNKAPIYFLDESTIQLTPVNGKTWGPKGKTTIVKKTGKRGRICAISAISPSQKLFFSLQEETFNGKCVISFLKQIERNHPNKKIAVVMDNAPCHTSKVMKEYLKNSSIKVFFLPPYSPEMNPDEKVWNYLKSSELVSHVETSVKDLKKLTSKKMRSIARQPKLLRGIFMRCEISKFFL
jgi:transposase